MSDKDFEPTMSGTAEAMDAAPADSNPIEAIPVYKGHTRQMTEEIAKDPRIKDVIKKFTGYAIPEHMYKRDHNLLVELKGLVDKYGVDGAVSAAHKSLPRQRKVQIRALVIDLIRKEKDREVGHGRSR